MDYTYRLDAHDASACEYERLDDLMDDTDLSWEVTTRGCETVEIPF